MFLEATCFQRVAGTCVGKESERRWEARKSKETMATSRTRGNKWSYHSFLLTRITKNWQQLPCQISPTWGRLKHIHAYKCTYIHAYIGDRMWKQGARGAGRKGGREGRKERKRMYPRYILLNVFYKPVVLSMQLPTRSKSITWKLVKKTNFGVLFHVN